jgi:hypothetical protein
MVMEFLVMNVFDDHTTIILMIFCLIVDPSELILIFLYFLIVAHIFSMLSQLVAYFYDSSSHKNLTINFPLFPLNFFCNFSFRTVVYEFMNIFKKFILQAIIFIDLIVKLTFFEKLPKID